jgi:hypothetical protein
MCAASDTRGRAGTGRVTPSRPSAPRREAPRARLNGWYVEERPLSGSPGSTSGGCIGSSAGWRGVKTCRVECKSLGLQVQSTSGGCIGSSAGRRGVRTCRVERKSLYWERLKIGQVQGGPGLHPSRWSLEIPSLAFFLGGRAAGGRCGRRRVGWCSMLWGTGPLGGRQARMAHSPPMV